MEDMLEQTNEIMDVLGKPYGLPEDVDEDDLEAGVWCGDRCGLSLCVCVCVCDYTAPSLSHSLTPLPPPSPPPPPPPELEALGDEYLGELDEDAGFLDAAVAAPDPPSGVPGGKSKVQVCTKRRPLDLETVL